MVFLIFSIYSIDPLLYLGSRFTSQMQILESMHWSHLFHSTLKDLEKSSSYCISKKVSYIKDLTTNDCHSISFREGVNRHKLGSFQIYTRNRIKDSVHHWAPFPPLQTKKGFKIGISSKCLGIWLFLFCLLFHNLNFYYQYGIKVYNERKL